MIVLCASRCTGLAVNVKITVEYDGTNYHGWQVQANDASIQAVLERAVSTFLGMPTRINGSGRTDAGVHALGQVANFFTDKEFLPYRILRGLNALTPIDITSKKSKSSPIASTPGATAEAGFTNIRFSIAQRRRRSI